ncbi:MAG: hypothetical protein BWY25_00569 [Chloroflexi bacterium ADurb.Bin222]|nr:MAG: hypothetical protein BWY25_00569 [Chloroflexi bacterium ADurb.Bin222]
MHRQNCAAPGEGLSRWVMEDQVDVLCVSAYETSLSLRVDLTYLWHI